MASCNSDKQKLTWLITGAASGFGLELCRLVLARGHRLIATSRNPAKVPDIVAEIEGHDGRGRWVKLDVDDADSASIIEQLEEEGEKIDVLVNNAGWSLHGPAECFAEDEVRRQMETMYFGPYRLIRAVLPHMRSRRRGLILNFGSGAGVNGRDSMGIYAASKAAMDGEPSDPYRLVHLLLS
jgi:NAD(P)-dependent dehydrogenase (short-subunit alcohol dehydrogenase family)